VRVPVQGSSGTELSDPDQGDATMNSGAAYLRDGDSLLSPVPSGTLAPPGTLALAGISGAWIGGLVAACTGSALAVVGVTLPWELVSSASRDTAVPVYLTDFGPVLAPSAAALLVTSAMCAGVCFASRSRLGSILRSANVVATMLWISVLMAATTYLVRGMAMDVFDPWTGMVVKLTVRGTTPSAGEFLYILGTTLLVLGTVASARLPGTPVGVPRVTRADARIAATRAWLRWAVTLVALGLAVASIVLPWYHRVSELGQSAVKSSVVTPHDVHVWLGIYRVGLVGCVLLYAAALMAYQGGMAGGPAPRGAAALRAIGMMASTVVMAVLLVGLAALWRADGLPVRQFGYPDASPHAAPGYLFAVAAMFALLGGIALIGPPVPSGPADPAGTVESSADPADAAASPGDPAETVESPADPAGATASTAGAHDE
jgi:hypothetical protein